MCAYRIPNNILLAQKQMSEKKEVDAQQKKRDEARQKRYIQRKEHYEELKKQNLQRFEKIEKEAGLRYFLQFVDVRDLGDIIIDNDYLGDVMAHEVMRVALYNELGITGDDITQMMINNTISDAFSSIKKENYLPYLETVLKKYPEHVDMDKLLLVVGLRASQYAASENVNKNDLKTVRTILEYIHSEVDPNTKIWGRFEQNNESKLAKFTVKDIEGSIKRLSIDGEYLSDKKLEEKRNALMNGEIFLSDINKLAGSAMGIGAKEIDFLVKNYPENFLYFLENFECSADQIRGVLKGTKKINSEILYKLLDEGIILDEELPDVCSEDKLEITDLVEIASLNMFDNSVFLDSAKEIMRCKDLKQSDIEILMQYFDKEKITECIGNEKTTGKFLNIYLEILPEDMEEKKKKLLELQEISETITNSTILIEMYRRGIDVDLTNKIDENEILEMYENEKIDLATIKRMQKNGFISYDTFALIVDDKYAGQDAAELLEKGEIDLKTAIAIYDGTKRKDIYSKYNYGGYETAYPALYAYGTGNMSIEQMNELYKHGIVKEAEIFEAAKQKVYSVSRLTELYVNLLISEDEIDELDYLSDSDKKFMKKALEMKNIADNMDTSLGFNFDEEGQMEFDETIFLPMKKIIKEPTTLPEYQVKTDKKSRRVIPPFLREKKILSYGFKKLKREKIEYNEKSPFNDYEFYALPDENGKLTPSSIVIAERYYKDRFSGEEKLATDNATYIFELKDLTRISKKSKTEVLQQMKETTDSRMDKFSHTKYWAKNYDKKMHKLLNISMYEDKKDEIEELTKMIDGFKEKDGNFTDLYGIYIYE